MLAPMRARSLWFTVIHMQLTDAAKSPAAAAGRELVVAPTVRSMSVALGCCMFAAQASLVVVSPVLATIAAEFEVSTAAAGQLRALSGGVAGTVALVIVASRQRHRLAALLRLGLSLTALGAGGSAAAASFPALAAAQVLMAVGLAMVLSSAVAATATWPPPQDRRTVLSWALIGQPAAWIIGLPLAGVVGGRSWRYVWIIPLAAAMLAVVLTAGRRDGTSTAASASTGPLLHDPPLRWWSAAELGAFAGWAGALVYAGGRFREVDGTSLALTGVLLGVGALLYVPGNLLAKRCPPDRKVAVLVALALAMALTVLVFAAAPVRLPWSCALFGLFGFLGGARTFLGSELGLSLAGVDRLRAMGLRTAAQQFGYLAGAGLGGLALARYGWAGLGVVLASLLASATFPLAAARRPGADSPA